MGIDILRIVLMFLPLIRRRYWFFNAYFVVFMFSPLLNHLIRTLRKKTFQYFLFAAGFVLVIAISLAIFIGCIALDYIRIILFKILKINMLCDKLGKNITKLKRW